MDLSQLAVIGGFISAIAALFTSIVVGLRSATREEMKDIQSENRRLRKRMRVAECRQQDFERWAQALVRQVRELGGEPAELVLSVIKDEDDDD